MITPSSDVSRLFRGVVGKGLAVGDISAGAELSEKRPATLDGTRSLQVSAVPPHSWREDGGVDGSRELT